MANGTALTAATGDNTNALMQPYVMPDPIVADHSKIPATTLPTTYLYDIPTTAGQEIELVDLNETTAIRDVTPSDCQHAVSSTAYSIDGRRVSDAYHGIIIMNGQKYIRK